MEQNSELLERIETDRNVADYKKRYCYEELKNHLETGNGTDGKITGIIGLRRTGKTTLMNQLAEEYGIDHFYQVKEGQSMKNVYLQLEECKRNGEKIVLIDEITNAEDFVDNSALLADKYAKEGLSIVVAGTDSLRLSLSMNNSLMNRIHPVYTTYIPFVEHCEMLDLNDMEDYIVYGGLMRKGKDESAKKELLDDINSRRYLNSAVAGNISHSLKSTKMPYKYPETAMHSQSDLEHIINKAVAFYSGVIEFKKLNEPLKKANINLPTRELIPSVYSSEYDEWVKAKNEEYANLINAEGRLEIPATKKLVEELEEILSDLNLLSHVKEVRLNLRNGELERKSTYSRVYIIQPAIKYHQLRTAQEFIEKAIEESDYFPSGVKERKETFLESLKRNIMGSMTEAIILYDVTNMLNPEDYEIVKPVFFDNGTEIGEYDMLIMDRKTNTFFAFEINYSDRLKGIANKHLIDGKLEQISENLYGKKEGMAILYSGESMLQADFPEVPCFNIGDFMKSLHETRDIRKTYQSILSEIKKICSVKSLF